MQVEENNSPERRKLRGVLQEIWASDGPNTRTRIKTKEPPEQQSMERERVGMKIEKGRKIESESDSNNWFSQILLKT